MNFQVRCYVMADQSIHMSVYNNITHVSNNIMFYKNEIKYISYRQYCQKVIIEYLLENSYVTLINVTNYQNKLEKYANYTLQLTSKSLLKCL